MESRRVLLAVLLSVAVLVVWQVWFAPPPPERSFPEAPPAAGPAAAAGTDLPDRAAAEQEEKEEPVAEGEPIAGEREETIVVESDLYRAELTNRGGRLVSFVLEDHRARDGGLVDLVRRRAEDRPLPFSLVDPA
ncbi:MAG TPA: membrane protein insertase YidC, partial [Thermoanaerobaculia bacterium]